MDRRSIGDEGEGRRSMDFEEVGEFVDGNGSIGKGGEGVGIVGLEGERSCCNGLEVWRRWYMVERAVVEAGQEIYEIAGWRIGGLLVVEAG